MSLYLALGIGGVGAQHKVNLGKDVGTLVEANQTSYDRYKITIPVSAGYCYDFRKWQIKGDVSVSTFWNASYRDFGHVKMAIGYRLTERLTLSAVGGLGLGYVIEAKLKTIDNRVILLKPDSSNNGFYHKSIFLGGEIQVQMKSRLYGIMTGHICLPVFNEKVLPGYYLVSSEDMVAPNGVLELRAKQFKDCKGANIKIPVMGRAMAGIMFTLGG